MSIEEGLQTCSSCGAAVPTGSAGCHRRSDDDWGWLCNGCLAELDPILALQLDAFTVLRGVGQLELEDVPLRDLWRLSVAIARATERRWGPVAETPHLRRLIDVGIETGALELEGARR